MLRKSAVVLLSSAMLFNTFGFASANASATTSEVSSTLNEVNIPAEVETVSVRDIVPSEYFEAVEGKYKSKEEILKATGYKVEKTEAASTMEFSQGAMTVNDLDEYAALLTYYSDNANKNSDASSFQARVITEPDSDTETVWGDGLAGGANLSWISASVYYQRNSMNGNIVNITGTSSTLLGFHPGNSWTHDNYATINSAYLQGTTGHIYIKGTRTLSIIIEGIGNIVSKQESYFMGLS